MDVNKDAGYLIKKISRYESFSEIQCGDAIECLKSLNTKIDFYFSDGYRSYSYEQDEFASLEHKINVNTIVITNKATFSKALFEFSHRLNKNYSFFREHPSGHWYEGAGIGIMYS
jgi:hypothetical protein